MAPTVQKFLALKGGVGLLSVLNERGKTYSEIESEVAITSDTISKRKDEALEIGLIEMKPARRKNRTVTEYHLTDLGEELVRQMSLMGIVSNYQSMRTHQREVDAKTADLIDWVYENPNQLLEFTESREETLIDRSEPDDENTEPEADGSEDEPSPRVVRPHPDDIDESSDKSNDWIEQPEDENQSSLAEMEDGEVGDPGDDESSEDKVERINRIVEDAEQGRDLSSEEPEYPDEFMEDSGADDDDSETGSPEYPDEFMERYVVGDEDPPDDEVPEDLQPHEVWGSESDDGEIGEEEDESE